MIVEGSRAGDQHAFSDTEAHRIRSEAHCAVHSSRAETCKPTVHDNASRDAASTVVAGLVDYIGGRNSVLLARLFRFHTARARTRRHHGSGTLHKQTAIVQSRATSYQVNWAQE